MDQQENNESQWVDSKSCGLVDESTSKHTGWNPFADDMFVPLGSAEPRDLSNQVQQRSSILSNSATLTGAGGSEEADAFGQAFDALRSPGGPLMYSLNLSALLVPPSIIADTSQTVDPFGAAPFNKAIAASVMKRQQERGQNTNTYGILQHSKCEHSDSEIESHFRESSEFTNAQPREHTSCNETADSNNFERSKSGSPLNFQAEKVLRDSEDDFLESAFEIHYRTQQRHHFPQRRKSRKNAEIRRATDYDSGDVSDSDFNGATPLLDDEDDAAQAHQKQQGPTCPPADDDDVFAAAPFPKLKRKPKSLSRRPINGSHRGVNSNPFLNDSVGAELETAFPTSDQRHFANCGTSAGDKKEKRIDIPVKVQRRPTVALGLKPQFTTDDGISTGRGTFSAQEALVTKSLYSPSTKVSLCSSGETVVIPVGRGSEETSVVLKEATMEVRKGPTTIVTINDNTVSPKQFEEHPPVAMGVNADSFEDISSRYGFSGTSKGNRKDIKDHSDRENELLLVSSSFGRKKTKKTLGKRPERGSTAAFSNMSFEDIPSDESPPFKETAFTGCTLKAQTDLLNRDDPRFH
ncbi:AP2-associated protein kinase 1-like [Tropilaelaps mercedesae]|uniref:AP2-associated protein kinase 1-like n=1 Tax=Tropilaelaps mercedesae TaxID=418985 RepID=A0A1V9X859_9ACAR|nr:AP2-associated protein kinase 1-like [Tropilaelaps mercedesae]